jgi:hypothetical protein
MQAPPEFIHQFYNDPKTGLSINNTFRNLLKSGYKVTSLQVDKAIKSLDEYHKTKTHTEQKSLFLQTVTGNMTSYQADVFMIKHVTQVKFVAFINIETRKAYVYHIPNLKAKSVLQIFNQWIKDIPPDQYPTVISTDLGSEFNSRDFYKWLESKKIRLFYINKSDYKTTYATALVDRLIRTIREKLERYQKLNDSKSIIKAMSDIIEGYNNSIHRVLGKTPNEMTLADVQQNAEAKRKHNEEIMQKFYDKAKDQPVGILSKKNIFDKGSKMKLSRDKHEIEGIEGYNFVLDNGRKHPPKDLKVLNSTS